MKQKAEKISIVETPDSWDDIITFTQGASSPADATVAALMAWNFAVEWHAKQDSCCDELRRLRGLGEKYGEVDVVAELGDLNEENNDGC